MFAHVKRFHHKESCLKVSTSSGSCNCGYDDAIKEIENFEKFVKLVKDMRTAQKNYFKTRLSGDLRTSKLYESDVDKLVERVLNGEKQSAKDTQKGLL